MSLASMIASARMKTMEAVMEFYDFLHSGGVNDSISFHAVSKSLMHLPPPLDLGKKRI